MEDAGAYVVSGILLVVLFDSFYVYPYLCLQNIER